MKRGIQIISCTYIRYYDNDNSSSIKQTRIYERCEDYTEEDTQVSTIEGAFVEKVVCTLCKMISDKPDTFDQETVTGFNDAVMKYLKPDGSLVVVHNQRHRFGRFYADNNVSLIPHERRIKHTLFTYDGWVDLDMVKGHPSIALAVFEGILKLPAIKTYVDTFDNIVYALSNYCTTNSTLLDSDYVKWLFNMMVYGGTPNGWVK